MPKFRQVGDYITMGFGVFIHRSDSIYDDSPAERYQFPRQYLKRVADCVNNWIVYYEPTKVINARGYYAVAKVQEVIPDFRASGMYIAVIEPGSFLQFVNPVPFNGPDGISEQGVLNEKGAVSGRAQSAVRPLSAADFNKILDIGLAESPTELPRIGSAIEQPGFHEQQALFHQEEVRSRANYLSSRIVRDRVFRQVVLRAYDARCAMTGLKLINGGGRAEAEAAHIRPVAANGPDIVSNGLALSGTVHWMFDRGLISVADNDEILLSRYLNDVDGVRHLINKSGRIWRPLRVSDQPHPRFLAWHRENCFKG